MYVRIYSIFLRKVISLETPEYIQLFHQQTAKGYKLKSNDL